ncbi:MAG: GIY-YIG nuclease family protein [Candidatus Nanoarchaeia archaeon]
MEIYEGKKFRFFLENLSGKDYKFLRGIEGVYGYFTGKKECLYVGRSSNLARRLDEHGRSSGIENMMPEAELVEVVVCSNSRELERKCINEFFPRYNNCGLTNREGLKNI